MDYPTSGPTVENKVLSTEKMSQIWDKINEDNNNSDSSEYGVDGRKTNIETEK